MPIPAPIQRVLVIADCSESIDQLTDVIAPFGHVVDKLKSLAELTCDVLQETSIAFVDRKIPGFDRLMCQLNLLPHQPWIVVLTESRCVSDVLFLFRSGAGDVLFQPFEPSSLEGVISRMHNLAGKTNSVVEFTSPVPVDGVFTAVLHESRNSLQSIQAAIGMLEIECAGSVAALQQTKQVEIASDNLSKLLGTVEDALALRSPILE